jgi:hypothetical protein
VKLTTHLHLVPRSKNAWNYNFTPQYAFMAWYSVKSTGKTLPVYLLQIKILSKAFVVVCVKSRKKERKGKERKDR